ncbi:nitronate monooxygenase [Novosphingobium sp. MMS21-SN21R]|uniref:NAD(P)H-dependent flavin oxidoreductase n=1 Tax=Novosphingobium sp. MMS21-SN21R TaxID=2969298 RepID=UPI002886015F|nr:nitronate monooxygenase [Novosphingobium sp. MMS21-SN21R]MDT0508692.1 nitronate monooxygenase [Novosphingobium sp. MMS21-SN21R]
MRRIAQRLGLRYPLIQAPMAGTSTPALAAAVCEAGGLGSIAIGAVDAKAARTAIADLRGRTARPFNVNAFVHQQAIRDIAIEQAWTGAMTPLFARFGAVPPTTLHEIYCSLNDDPDMLAVLVEAAPAVVSFHFGLPTREAIAALKAQGCLLLASATSLAEAEAAVASGMDAVVAQGFEAGGHRGVFDPGAADEQLGTLELVRILAAKLGVPVIAAGGIMDGADIRAALNAGADAVQLGTAFVGCPESAADEGYRAVLAQAPGTTLTRAISGRPARCLDNAFVGWASTTSTTVPDYPVTYDAGKALIAAARAAGEAGFGAHWAGTGFDRARPIPAADLVALLVQEAGFDA